MIVLTKLNNALIALNCDLMQYIEETPDTVITLTSGNKVVVKERMDEVIGKVVGYRQRVARLVDAECEQRYGTE